MNNMDFDIINAINSIFNGFIFITTIFLIHILSSYHPYHRIGQLVIITILSLISAILLPFYFLSPNSNVTYIFRESLTNSLISILFLLPILYLMFTVILLKISFRTRPQDPLLDLLDSNLKFN